GPQPARLYSLSLHDALPISLGGRWSVAARLAGVALLNRLGHAVDAGLRRLLDLPSGLFAPGDLRELVFGDDLNRDAFLHLGKSRDRKSTRLNSAHVKISYAV